MSIKPPKITYILAFTFLNLWQMDTLCVAAHRGVKNIQFFCPFFPGDIEDEDEVLAWITDEETLEIPGRIEEVNSKMLDKIISERSFVVVFFCK